MAVNPSRPTTPQPQQGRPLSEADSLSALEPGWRRRDQLRRQPDQQEAQAALHGLMTSGQISVATLSRAMQEPDVRAAYERITQRIAEQQGQAPPRHVDPERLARWRRHVESLAPDSPSAKWYDLSIGPARRERLYEQYRSLDEPPADWAGG